MQIVVSKNQLTITAETQQEKLEIAEWLLAYRDGDAVIQAVSVDDQHIACCLTCGGLFSVSAGCECRW